MKDSASEERQLREALRIADHSVDAEKHACAKISVRLAELSDLESDNKRQKQAEAFYRNAALLYTELIKNVDSTSAEEIDGAAGDGLGSESEYLLQLQLVLRDSKNGNRRSLPPRNSAIYGYNRSCRKKIQTSIER